MNKELISALEWRYATKRMNGQAISEDKLNTILEAVRLAPSSLGFTPYSILVVSDKSTKEKLSPSCFNQPQIVESDVLLIFANWTDFNEQQVDDYIQSIATTRNIPVDSLAGFAGNIKGKIKNSSNEELQAWASKQTYIAMGFGLTAAAVEQVDSTPMEGFNPAGVDEVLGLKEKGLTSACILALGYRNPETDYLVSAKKVRRDSDKLFIRI
jgi:nitroreductase